MFKLSKESRNTFFALLPIPVIWMAINHFGYLDYLKTKTVDWRMVYRGEIPQNSTIDAADMVKVEGNYSVPRIPKVTYVNFDAETLSMDGVGERPWDRAFFRDTAMTLLEKGKARSIGFDFGFTPKSMSSMVPKENSYRSDLAMGDLVASFPDKVVLGCLYSGVPTPFVKSIEASAFPPMFVDGYSQASGKFSYPEAPTYPLQSFSDGDYIGRMGSFTVPPFRAVDEIPRWVPLWFPAGGKAHAYNVLGGKRSVLGFELPRDNASQIEQLKFELPEVQTMAQSLEDKLDKATFGFASKSEQKSLTEDSISTINELFKSLDILNEEIDTLGGTLKANPSLASLLDAQIQTRKVRENELYRKVKSLLSPGMDSGNDAAEWAKELAGISQQIENFSNTLKANPGLSAVISPQLDLRKKRRDELKELIVQSSSSTEGNLFSNEQKTALFNDLTNLLKDKKAELEQLVPVTGLAALELTELQEARAEIENTYNEKKTKLERLEGKADTELVEHEGTLRLVYRREGGEDGPGELVNSLPNVMPLIKEANIYTLGLESLLAYYNLSHEDVRISKEQTLLSVIAKDGTVLVEAPLEEDQWLEVNWFSSWTNKLLEKKLIREAKRAYGDQNMVEYLGLAPQIIRLFLHRVEDLELPKADSEMPSTMRVLGVDPELVDCATRLINGKPSDLDIPNFEKLRAIVNGIAYYFIPPSVLSPYNPMCGMKDILDYGRFHEQVSENLNSLTEFIKRLNGPEYLEKIETALKADPKNEKLLAQKSKIETAIIENKANLVLQQEEMARINKFFECFKDAIVLVGPEEKTFQDLAPTPFDSSVVPKVSVHGNLIKTLTNGEFIHRLPVKVDHFATLAVCLLMAFLAVYQGKRASIVQATGIILLVAYVLLGFETFSQSHVIWPITAPACAGLSTSFIGLAAMVVIEQKAKGRLKGMFGSYVSSDLVEEMVASGKEPSLGGEETKITAFFSDVQAFSSFSELLTPTGLVDLMNEYLTEMTNILQEERGTLDKYIGDAIVAMYGAPIPMEDHAYQAVKTSILMQQRQISLREKWVPEVEKWGKCHGLVTQMQTRIGCNTGTATVGNMGALDRFNYTMMGDMVNLAARCESGAKAYGAYIMVTEETMLASETTKDDIAFRYLDKIVVKGRSQPVAMYEPTGFMSELTQETQDCLDCFKQGIDKYLLQDWDGALNLFEKAKEMEPNKPGVTPGVKDNPSMILIDRCKIMKENPPGDDWDGVYVMTTK
jgi:class 3 adenylate cyclase